jgi:DnaJ-class molecular chaperone
VNIYDAYKTLGLEKGAAAKEAKKVYRKLARQYHPDVNPDGEEAMKKIVSAYDCIIAYGFQEAKDSYAEYTNKAHNTGRNNVRQEAERKKEYARRLEALKDIYYAKKAFNSMGDVYLIVGWLISSKKAKEMSDLWITYDLRVMLLKDMATSHVANCVKFIERNGTVEFHQATYDKMQAILNRRQPETTTVGKKVKIKLEF